MGKSSHKEKEVEFDDLIEIMMKDAENKKEIITAFISNDLNLVKELVNQYYPLKRDKENKIDVDSKINRIQSFLKITEIIENTHKQEFITKLVDNELMTPIAGLICAAILSDNELKHHFWKSGAIISGEQYELLATHIGNVVFDYKEKEDFFKEKDNFLKDQQIYINTAILDKELAHKQVKIKKMKL